MNETMLLLAQTRESGGLEDPTQLVVMGVVLALVALVGFLVVRALRRRSHRLKEPEAPQPQKREAPGGKRRAPARAEAPELEEAEEEPELGPPPAAAEFEEVEAPPAAAPPAAEVPPAAEAPVLFEIPPPASMRDGLAKTRSGFVARLGGLFRSKQIDEDLLEAVEEVLFTSDIGVRTSQRLLEGMREALSRKELADQTAVWTYLRARSREILDGAGGPRGEGTVDLASGPEVVMVVGVNGTGKTTTIGKLAARYKAAGRRILLAAGDTFRAAAVEQLSVWAKRVKVDVFAGEEAADPASVVFDAIQHAQKEGHDLVVVDTAGRLHTKVNLMEELKKVDRVIGKARPGAPHEILLVLDATTGQNAIQQATLFKEAVGITGIVLTKLDGTAKGGVVLGISDVLGVPIRYVGVGEKLQDLRPFDAEEFIQALYADN